jgi:hypothetical protein
MRWIGYCFRERALDRIEPSSSEGAPSLIDLALSERAPCMAKVVPMEGTGSALEHDGAEAFLERSTVGVRAWDYQEIAEESLILSSSR